MTTNGSRTNSTKYTGGSFQAANVSHTFVSGHANTFSVVAASSLDKTVVVRGANVTEVSVPYDAQKEAERRKNLIANRGPERSTSTFSK